MQVWQGEHYTSVATRIQAQERFRRASGPLTAKVRPLDSRTANDPQETDSGRPARPKGQGQSTMLRIFTFEEAAAAEAAGIDVVSVPPALATDPEYRQVADLPREFFSICD